ncbi:MAG TPA: hypothetical protein DCW41_01130 [Clostridiales bacterium]|nr:hypothetical protein [Clostridiales bacterium]
MKEEIKSVLDRYDKIVALILDQKVDEFADRMDEKPPNEDDATYEQYMMRVAMEQTEEQSRTMQDEPDDNLGGLSMNEYFRTLEFKELKEILEYCAKELDRGVPDSVIKAVASKEDRNEIEAYCGATIEEAAWTEEELKNEDALFEMEFQKVKACFKVLSAMGCPSLLNKVTDRFMSYDKVPDFVAESIAEYIEAFPGESVPLIKGILEDHKDDGLKGPCEDLVVMLTNIGKGNRSDEIYDILRMSFRYMENKIYAVICLADYGDDRAVPMLKSYINRHQDTIDRDLFYEMMSAIQNLGGDIEDISDPFGDFQKKFN